MTSAQHASTSTASTAHPPSQKALKEISREINEALSAVLAKYLSRSPSPSADLLSFKAPPQEELTLERLVTNQWISVDMAMPSQDKLELIVELQDLSLTHILLWVCEQKVPYHFDEHEDVYTFELSFPFQEDIDCELSFTDGASSRFMLFPANSNSNNVSAG